MPETWSVPPPRTMLPLLERFATETLPPLMFSAAAPLTVMGPAAVKTAPLAMVRLAEPKVPEPRTTADALLVCVSRDSHPETRIEPVALPPASARSKAPAKVTAAPELMVNVPPVPGKESAATAM